ncbi:hypothetical protein Dsin_019454 [Dipteronia sinensis]|uniref:Amino acid transporter transmembrane domain-containing protein n=1 Tax=Dipteronia sinensis TaxID=43782 RepID=A0AAE0E2U6_9ROSI|nr:hypothetical protein Dsin_019454 [Dipteronia sinensis]
MLGLRMAFISLIYGSFGALGYFAFGEETKDIITTNRGAGSVSILVQMDVTDRRIQMNQFNKFKDRCDEKYKYK